MSRRVLLELEGPRHEVDRAVGAFFDELRRMDTEAAMSEPIWNGLFGETERFHRVLHNGHSIKGAIRITEKIG